VRMKPPLIELFYRSYNRILQEGFAFHEVQPPLVRAPAQGERKRRGRQRRRTGHNLLRLSTCKEACCASSPIPTFPSPITKRKGWADDEGQAEDLRWLPVGGGAITFVIIRSVISTARKQGWSVLETLTADPRALIQSLRLN
jgi:transposase